MSGAIRILIVEDMPTDVELICHALRQEGIEFTCRNVDTPEGLLRELAEFSPQIVLSDYSMPNFDGLSALRLTRQHSPLLPFIIITGSINEETAVECIKRGADDYMTKDHLARLAFAVQGALEKARIKLDNDNATQTIIKTGLQWRTTMDAIREAVCLLDEEGNVIRCNAAFRELAGRSYEEIIGENCCLILHGEPPSFDCCSFLRMKRSLRRESMDSPLRGRLFNISADPILDGEGLLKGAVQVMRDVTEHRQLEEQYRQAQKMEAVGQLAGGIAHDFNNLLQVIMGNAQMALRRADAAGPLAELLGEIVGASTKAADLTRSLLAFSRRQIMHPVDLDLNRIVAKLLEMVRRVIGEQIEIDFIPGHRLGTIHADPGHFEQALMNLCLNARDAMAQGGRLTIETQNVSINGEYRRSHPWITVEGRYALLSVSDTGCGMSEEVRERIFEPFFTTKGPQEGTGLGLATVYGIVKQHDGYVHVYSELGKGSIFKIYLPIVARAAVDVSRIVKGTVPRGTETILVVEDEAIVQSLVRRVLEGAGYTLLEAADGEEALRVFAEHAAQIDLALLDVVLPKMSGHEVAQRIEAIRPGVPILFTSGYSPNSIHTGFVLDKDVHLIQKPYNPEDLLRKIREVLDE